MAKYKPKNKDSQLVVKVKLGFNEKVDEQQFETFSGKYIRGLLSPVRKKKKVFEYRGPVGIRLKDRLKNPVGKYDFLFIMEQITDMVQKLNANALLMGNLVLDIENVFINETTREMHFIYLPLENGGASGGPDKGDIKKFMEQIIYACKLKPENDMEYISRFTYFLGSMRFFDPVKTEKYIAKEDRNVVRIIKRHSVGQSGFITDKPGDYYEHYRNKGMNQNDSFDEATGLLNESLNDSFESSFDEATGLLDNSYDDATGLLGNSYDEATGLLQENYNDFQDGAIGLSNTNKMNYVNDTSGLYNDHEMNYMDDDATGLLSGNEMDYVDEDATGLLQEETVNSTYPCLYRFLTDENILINKPVFRIGKKKGYSDYFVTDNRKVSRTHADIIRRGNKYYIADLNSKNKTYVNDEEIPVGQEVELNYGDKIRLANEEFEFRRGK